MRVWIHWTMPRGPETYRTERWSTASVSQIAWKDWSSKSRPCGEPSKTGNARKPALFLTLIQTRGRDSGRERWAGSRLRVLTTGCAQTVLTGENTFTNYNSYLGPVMWINILFSVHLLYFSLVNHCSGATLFNLGLLNTQTLNFKY